MRTESERLAQREAALAATGLDSNEGGYREMAVDVPDYVLEMDAKKKVGMVMRGCLIHICRPRNYCTTNCSYAMARRVCKACVHLKSFFFC